MDSLVVTVIATTISMAFFIYTLIRDFRADMDNRLDKMDNKFDLMDQRVTETNKRMDGVYNLLIKKMGG